MIFFKFQNLVFEGFLFFSMIVNPFLASRSDDGLNLSLHIISRPFDHVLKVHESQSHVFANIDHEAIE